MPTTTSITRRVEQPRSSADESSSSVIARIVPFIRERRFEAGDRIPSERELAERFGVSRGVIREALAALEAMRVVERRPQSGVFLREVAREGSLEAMVLEADLGIPMTAADVRSLYEFRNILEVQAVVLACDRRTEKDIAALDAVLEETRRRIDAGVSIADQDAEFHLAVIAATDNQFLVRAAHSFYLASRQRREHYFRDAANCKRSLAHHRKLRDAIAQGNAREAQRVMDDHLGGVERYWLSTLRSTARTKR